jgi:hypothetical protein
MKLHYTADGDMPDETASGGPIEYVWIVGRPAARSETGQYEMLGIHQTRDSAESHATKADCRGETELRREVLR